MNFTSQLFVTNFAWYFWPLVLLINVWAIKHAPWRTLLADIGLQHRYLGFTLALVVMWQLSIDLNVGVVIHFIGLTTITLLFGWPLAIIAGGLAQLVDTAANLQQWPMFALNDVLNVLLPVLGTWFIYQRIERLKPKNPFIFMLGVGFFGCVVTTTLTTFVAALLLKFFGQGQLNISISEFFGYLPIFVFPEAVINGMFISALTILHPHVVVTFDEERYFKHDEHHMILDEHIEPSMDLKQTEAPDDEDDSRYRPPKDWYDKKDDEK